MCVVRQVVSRRLRGGSELKAKKTRQAAHKLSLEPPQLLNCVSKRQL